jgi:radical SAM protein with 4Fe4S-binding SPASM domain
MHAINKAWRYGYLYLMLLIAALAARWPARKQNGDKGAQAATPGLSILIPERGTPDVLEQTLTALYAALPLVHEPVQIAVLVNGTPKSDYADLISRFDSIEWQFVAEPLGFHAAVASGLKHVIHPWTYLLNSDMCLDPHALQEVLVHRRSDVFAVASQIVFAEAGRRREETGWTDFADDVHGVEIFDRMPEPDDGVRNGLYAGGGSSLFSTSLLRRYVAESIDYAPFYYEDAEWGLRAWREGYATLFCPRSLAQHRHRATIGKFYDRDEVERILRRNRLLFDLRNAWTGLSPAQTVRRIKREDAKTQAELLHLPGMHRTLHARTLAMRARRAGFDPRAMLQHGVDTTSNEANTARTDALALRTAPLPRILWIELTSRCPFDCVFCSRKLLRGAGLHLDFELYRKLIAELKSPDIIRLNYSGESAHYPRIVEAAQLAASTGARVELVTTLAALPEHKLTGLVHSGLTRLTISLHTLDEEQFEGIYRFSSLATMRQRIEGAIALAKTAPRELEIDFAFVAMKRNLAQIDAVAEYAVRLGITRLAVHPVIRRDPIEETFEMELEDDRLRPAFVAELKARIDAVRIRHPQLAIESSTPELEHAAPLSVEPRYFPHAIPAGAMIHSCDQDPWETIHILADGSVVSCEQRDRITLGNLRTASLSELWHGESYRSFRAAYIAARDAQCSVCPYKKVRLSAEVPQRFLAPDTGRASLLDGWYADDAEKIVWSRTVAQMQLRANGKGRVKVTGYLPSGIDGRNRIEVRADGRQIAAFVNRGTALQEFRIDTAWHGQGQIMLEFATSEDYCPMERGESRDSRRLGFALAEASFDPP